MDLVHFVVPVTCLKYLLIESGQYRLRVIHSQTDMVILPESAVIMLMYRGIVGSVEYNTVDGLFHGHLEYIRDCVMYDGYTLDELKQSFEQAVDEYLARGAETTLDPTLLIIKSDHRPMFN